MPDPAPRPGKDTGTTQIRVMLDGDRAVCTMRSAALRAQLLSLDDRCAAVALVASRALLLGGDRVVIDIRVGASARLEVVEVGGTVAYNGRGAAAEWRVYADVGDSGTLVWNAPPFVVASGALVHRHTSVHLGQHARVMLRETLVLGRTGEAGGQVRATTRVDGPDRPYLAEDLDLDASRDFPGVLGPHRVLDQVLLAGRRPAAEETQAALPPGSVVLDLEAPGALARCLGTEAHRCDLGPLAATWSERLNPATGSATTETPQ